ncbi:Calcium-transporting ATPase 8 plasma membrane-type [Nymphaea thermarum]|nr:Calcium-transporting ATPase 8 plasma membrane-type [Nymphaea thermarum]
MPRPVPGPPQEFPSAVHGFGVGCEKLAALNRDHDNSSLQEYGGASSGNTKRNLVFLWEACQDTTLIILMIAAALSLGLGIKTEGIKEGWYDGGSIAFAVFLVIFVTGMSFSSFKLVDLSSCVD